jgi:enamine deaminase RidA (YjgF/YER057c/UK114 family)
MTDPAPDQAVVLARSHNGDVLDVFVHALPASTRDDQRKQFLSMAEQAYRALLDQGLQPGSIVSGWIRFASAPSWSWREALAEAWEADGGKAGKAGQGFHIDLLPITALLQAPADPFCACSLSLHAVRSAKQSGVWLAPTASPAATTVLCGGARHVRLMSVLPRAELGRRATVADMTYDMFAQAGHALTARGLSFANVVRTWVHAYDIDHNYPGINQGRNQYFKDQRLARLPASTCVEATVVGVDSPVAMDLYAVSDNPNVVVEAVAPGNMGEASYYGAAFARAAQLQEPGRRWLWISGTASIDSQGRVVSVGELQGQLDCMFANLASLLGQAGMGMGDVLSATAYLKRAEYLGKLRQAAQSHGLGRAIPCEVVVADICRPEWLCEIELCAARPEGRSAVPATPPFGGTADTGP